MKKLLTIAVLGITLIVAIVLVRTALHTPEESGNVETLALDVDAERAARRLSEAIRFKTISHGNPELFDASQFDGFIAWLAETYPEVVATAPIERINGYTALLRWPGSNPNAAPILLTGHYDVVPVIPGTEDSWEQPPFAGAIVDGVIWGRGALDDKSGVIAQLEAASMLISEGFTPNRDIYFSFGHDEEVGGQGAAGVAEHLAAGNVQLAWSLDEGSFVMDGLMPGLDKLFAPINVAEKGYLNLELTARGAGGHSSMPPKEMATTILAEALVTLDENPVPGGLSGLSEDMFDAASRHMSFTYRMPFANRWLMGGLLEEQLASVTFGNAMLRTTTAPTMLSGSVKANVLPIEAVATVNFRLHPRDTVEDVVAHVRRVVGDDVTVEIADGPGNEASEVSSAEAEGFLIIAQAVREVFDDAAIAPGLMIAASDTRHYGKVADDAYRFNPLKVTPDDMTGFHGTNEKMAVANLANGVRTYYRILQLAAGAELAAGSQ